jgi:hypothetical protein
MKDFGINFSAVGINEEKKYICTPRGKHPLSINLARGGLCAIAPTLLLASPITQLHLCLRDVPSTEPPSHLVEPWRRPSRNIEGRETGMKHTQVNTSHASKQTSVIYVYIESFEHSAYLLRIFILY